MRYYLAIDIGATSGRHIVGWSEGGEPKTEEVYRFPNGVTERDGHLTWDIDALLAFMEQSREPTVGELCERSQINRSTFYRHYLDVYDLMEKTETEIQKGLAQVLAAGEQEHLKRLTR